MRGSGRDPGAGNGRECAQLPNAAGALRGELILPELGAENGRARALLPDAVGAPRAELLLLGDCRSTQRGADLVLTKRSRIKSLHRSRERTTANTGKNTTINPQYSPKSSGAEQVPGRHLSVA